MSIRDWEKRKYREVFEQTCHQLEARRASDPTFTLQFLEGLLETAYVDLGNDWLGRGAVGDITQSATIAAYEHFLAEWKAQGYRQAGPQDAGGAPGADRSANG